jgi:hypothetical protein
MKFVTYLRARTYGLQSGAVVVNTDYDVAEQEEHLEDNAPYDVVCVPTFATIHFEPSRRLPSLHLRFL